MSEAGPPPTPEQRLRNEVSGLNVDEILALCYTFASKRERLRLYLDVLRKKGGQRAQFASCLICFDMARQGDEAAQLEFVYLADTIQSLMTNTEMVEALVGDDPYLTFIWELLEAQLEEMDQRFDPDSSAHHAPHEEESVASLDLLTDDDFGSDFGIEIDDTELTREFGAAAERFLGGIPGVPAYDPESGFRLRHRSDSERVERFLRELESFRELVPLARGYRALVLLFYGTHLRSKSLFGSINQRKAEILTEGLREWAASGDNVWAVVNVLSPLHSDRSVWFKIAELLADYVAWLARHPPDQQPTVDEYDAIGRIIERDSKRGRKGGRRRSRR